MELVAFLGRLAGIMIDPGLFIPVVIASLLLRRHSAALQVFASSLVGIAAAVVLAVATYQSRRAYGGSLLGGVFTFYALGATIWSVIIFAIVRALSRKRAT